MITLFRTGNGRGAVGIGNVKDCMEAAYRKEDQWKAPLWIQGAFFDLYRQKDGFLGFRDL